LGFRIAETVRAEMASNAGGAGRKAAKVIANVTARAAVFACMISAMPLQSGLYDPAWTFIACRGM
jgi:hypothetical protein